MRGITFYTAEGVLFPAVVPEVRDKVMRDTYEALGYRSFNAYISALNGAPDEVRARLRALKPKARPKGAR